MKSQEAWEDSNLKSANLMIWVGVTTGIFQTIFHFTLSWEWFAILSPSFMLALLLGIIPVVETHLKKHYDEEGVRKGPRF